MPNLNYEHHYIFTPVPDSWINKAKQIRQGEDDIPGVQRFDSDNRWAGKIGEWAFYRTYPYMKAVTSDYSAQEYDFYSPETDFRYDTKLNLSKRPFEDHFFAYIDQAQVDKSSCDIVVFQYWYEATRDVHFCGWLHTYQIAKRGVLYKKGDLPQGYKFPAHNDCYHVAYKDLNAMSVMWDQPQIDT